MLQIAVGSLPARRKGGIRVEGPRGLGMAIPPGDGPTGGLPLLAELEARWREYFDQAQEPGFTHCIGHAKAGDTFASWLEGAAAKRAHYRWAGIPHELIRKWTAECRRRNEAIRKLQTTPPD